jgi:hypothetical protein
MRGKLIALALVLFASTTVAFAGTTTASLYTSGGTLGNFGNATGWYFTPNTSVIVDQLGVYDHGAAGLASSHDVGIFTASGAPVTSATVPAGLSGTLIDGSRFVSVTPVTLNAGSQYYILGNNWQTDQFVFGTGAVVYAPQIVWNGFGDGNSNNINDGATNFGGVPGNLGPNFRFAIPEPSTALLAGGVVAIGALKRSRRQLTIRLRDTSQ